MSQRSPDSRDGSNDPPVAYPPTGRPAAEDASNADTVRRLLAPLAADTSGNWTPERARQVWGRIDQRRQRQMRRSRWFGPGLFAAAGVAAAVMVLWVARFEFDVPDHSEAATAAQGHLAGRADPLEEPSSAGVALAGQRITGETRLPSGAYITVSDGAVQVALATLDRTRIELEHGKVMSTVPKLLTHQSFVVETPQVQVSVVGTRFTVSLIDDRSTAVSVEEGVVLITPRDGGAETRLHAGQSWRSGSAPVAGAPVAEKSGEPSWEILVAGWRETAQSATEELRRQNALVKMGRLLSQHAPDRAFDHWRAFHERFPESPHVEEAAFRAAEALRQLGRTKEAQKAARAFRAQFPGSPYAELTRTW